MEDPPIFRERPAYTHHKLPHNHRMIREGPSKAAAQRLILPRLACPPSRQQIPPVVHGACDLYQVDEFKVLVNPDPIRHPQGVSI